MGVLYAMTRRGPDCYFALEVERYEERYPGRGVLLDTFKTRLTNYLPGAAWQPKAPATADRPEKLGKLAGQPAYVFEFEGAQGDYPFEGECVILEHQGFVYWFFTFAPQSVGEERKAARAEWAALRDAFKVLNQREDWEPQPRRSGVHEGDGYERAGLAKWRTSASSACP
jgi:hypothetical protein